jgi:hypothetical protein
MNDKAIMYNKPCFLSKKKEKKEKEKHFVKTNR